MFMHNMPSQFMLDSGLTFTLITFHLFNDYGYGFLRILFHKRSILFMFMLTVLAQLMLEYDLILALIIFQRFDG
jgi:hypothetical protein